MNAIVTGGRNGLLGPVWVDELENLGYSVFTYDLPDQDMLDYKTLEEFAQSFDTIDVLINNAAIDPKPDAPDFGDPWLMWNAGIQVNLAASGELIKHSIDALKRGQGLIINVCSIMAEIAANPDNYPDDKTKAFTYNVSKRGLVALTDCINAYYRKDGIRAVAPIIGPFERGISPAFMESFGKKFGDPISEDDVRAFLRYAIECKSLAGKIPLERGYTRVGR